MRLLKSVYYCHKNVVSRHKTEYITTVSEIDSHVWNVLVYTPFYKIYIFAGNKTVANGVKMLFWKLDMKWEDILILWKKSQVVDANLLACSNDF